MKRTIVVAICQIYCFLSYPVKSADLCDSLQHVLADARNQFVNLRENYNFSFSEFKGAIILGSLGECYTESGDGVASYWCDLCNLPDDQSYAADQLTRLDQGVGRCLGRDIDQRSRQPNRIRYTYLPTGDDITLAYTRIKPHKGRLAHYCVKLDVTFIEVAR